MSGAKITAQEQPFVEIVNPACLDPTAGPQSCDKNGELDVASRVLTPGATPPPAVTGALSALAESDSHRDLSIAP